MVSSNTLSFGRKNGRGSKLVWDIVGRNHWSAPSFLSWFSPASLPGMRTLHKPLQNQCVGREMGRKKEEGGCRQGGVGEGKDFRERCWEEKGKIME